MQFYDRPVFCQNYRIWMCCFAKVNQLEYSSWLYLFTCTANEMIENSFVNTSKFGMSESGPFAKIIIIIIKIKSKALSKPGPHGKNIWSHWLHGSQHFTLLWVHWQWAESYYHYSPQFKIWNTASVSLRTSCHVCLSVKDCQAQGKNTSEAVTGKCTLGVIRAAWSLISK